MALCDVQVIFKTTTGLPADFITNSWHIDDGEVTSSYAAFGNQLKTFYTAFLSNLPSYIEKNGHEIKVYKVSDPEPRAPVYEEVWDFIAAPTGNPLPLEVASCLSYQAAPISGIPQARRRGRVYIGPLNVNTIDTTGRISSAFRSSLAGAGQDLLDASNSSVTWKWSTHSRVLGTGAQVASGWVDDEPDTQRRRGRRPTTRTIFS